MDKIEQMRARLGEILAAIKEFEELESYTDEQTAQIDALNAEFESLTKQIEAAEKVAAMSAKAEMSTRKVSNGPTRVEVSPSKKELMGGFNSVGEYLMAVKNAAYGNIDKRFQAAMFEKNGEDGGFLVPESILTEIQKKLSSSESLLARTRQMEISGNMMTVPVDESAPWSGGIRAYWVAEGSPLQESKPSFKEASLRLHKLAGLVKMTEELLSDATGLESHIRANAPEAVMQEVNKVIISGDGVGKPEGILKSGFKVQVAKEPSQAADTVVARNVIKMYSALLPQARTRAAWFIHPAVEAQLYTMKADDGSFIYLAPGAQMNQRPYGLLMGLPVIPLLEGMPQLGDEGDIILADLSYYYTAVKAAGVRQAVSTHLLFDRDMVAYKFVMRIDGKCPFSSPVKTEYGNYAMSGIVTLEAR